MAQLQNYIPIRWAGGPLEIALRGKTPGFTPQTRQVLERFHDPASLGILDGSPIDCLVVSWAGGLPEDAAQQHSAAPLVEAARRRNLAVVGWVSGAADHNAAIAAARSAGLAGLVIQGFQGKADFPVIPCCERAAMAWDSTAPVLALAGNVWPGVSRQGFGADAGQPRLLLAPGEQLSRLELCTQTTCPVTEAERALKVRALVLDHPHQSCPRRTALGPHFERGAQLLEASFRVALERLAVTAELAEPRRELAEPGPEFEDLDCQLGDPGIDAIERSEVLPGCLERRQALEDALR